ncbi:flagellar protein [Paenibacillus sp. N1-5-1-14]|uniref:TIGR03826 family flagellar region protein n=1 Tax=Paenibacillus radicibacter TaxID=2972488 RepID=UPI002158B1B3|nr:TIGR03826 family flagellar region protein [Paenibacillus radicibacter]MCR8645046.1 flagellar protein [Paenibacillus radicibacter]
MGFQNIFNCPSCGRVFVKGVRDICNVCYQKVEEQYDACVKYLREQKTATLYEVSDVTGVSVKQITKFVREGRISLAGHPNMTYPCEICSTPIRDNMMCDSCRNKLAKDYKQVQASEQHRKAAAEEDTKLSYNIQDRINNRR